VEARPSVLRDPATRPAGRDSPSDIANQAPRPAVPLRSLGRGSHPAGVVIDVRLQVVQEYRVGANG